MTEHYFSPDPGTPDQRRQVSATIWGNAVELTTAAGVFAREGLDKGTAVLFRRLESPDPDAELTLLDLGCGYGPIAIGLALACPRAYVWAVDVNRRALELTELNAAANGVADRVRAAEPDEVPPSLRFDQLWSNPPVHAGKAALHALLVAWLPRVDGPAHLVVGRHLGADPLQVWLTQQGYPAVRAGSAKGFRVLVAERAAATPG